MLIVKAQHIHIMMNSRDIFSLYRKKRGMRYRNPPTASFPSPNPEYRRPALNRKKAVKAAREMMVTPMPYFRLQHRFKSAKLMKRTSKVIKTDQIFINFFLYISYLLNLSAGQMNNRLARCFMGQGTFFTIGLFPPQQDYRLHMGGSWEHIHRLDPHRLVALLLK